MAKRPDLQGSLVQYVQEMLCGSTSDESSSDRNTSNEPADDNQRWKLIITETMEDVLNCSQSQSLSQVSLYIVKLAMVLDGCYILQIIQSFWLMSVYSASLITTELVSSLG